MSELSPHDAQSIASGAPTGFPSGAPSSTLNSSAVEAVYPLADEVAPDGLSVVDASRTTPGLSGMSALRDKPLLCEEAFSGHFKQPR